MSVSGLGRSRFAPCGAAASFPLSTPAILRAACREYRPWFRSDHGIVAPAFHNGKSIPALSSALLMALITLACTCTTSARRLSVHQRARMVTQLAARSHASASAAGSRSTSATRVDRRADHLACLFDAVAIADADVVLAAPFGVCGFDQYRIRINIHVRDDDALPIVGPDEGRARLDALHGAFVSIDLDLVVDVKRLAQQDEQSRQPVLQYVLERKTDRDRTDAQPGDQITWLQRRNHDGGGNEKPDQDRRSILQIRPGLPRGCPVRVGPRDSESRVGR